MHRLPVLSRGLVGDIRIPSLSRDRSGRLDDTMSDTYRRMLTPRDQPREAVSIGSVLDQSPAATVLSAN